MRSERRSRGSSGGSLSDSRLLRLFFFGALYLAQGIPWGFISTGYVVFLADLGLSNEAVGGALGLAYFPWSFKLAWGPLLDRYRGGRFGRRRPFIVLAQVVMGASLLALLLCDPRRQLSGVTALLFVHNTFAALQDVAVDGLAVDALPEDERGRANSVMWTGKLAGVALGGGGGTLLAKYLGWPALFVTMAASLWLIMLLPILVTERSGGETPAPKRIDFAELWRSFAFPAPLLGLLISLVTPAGYALAGAFTTRMYRAHLHLDEKSIATLAVAEPVAGAAGALVGGFVTDKLGQRKTIGLFMALIGATIGVFAAQSAAWPFVSFLLAYTVVVQVAIAAYSVASFSFFMALSNPAIGATQFTAYMAMANLCYAFTSPLGGRLADRLGYVPTYAIAAAIQVVTIPLLLLCDPRQAEARFRGEKAPTAASPT